jgi:[protein-PII] uridylyltransferase
LMAKPGSVSKALTRMHRLGIMERILPEFERAMMTRSERPTDPYTVGKHTLIAISYLDEIRESEPAQPFSSNPTYASETEELNAVYQQLSEVNPLYMALLLHDIDKPDSNHPQTGAERAAQIAGEFGFGRAQVDEICFLIREHLTMIGLARYHRLDEKLITTFQRKLRSLDRLMKLYLLTYCDSKANGPQNFSELDKDNLRRLYKLMRSRFIEQEEQWGIYADPEVFRRFLQQMPVSYRITHSPQETAMHIKLANQVESQSPKEENSTQSALQFIDRAGYTELHLCSYNRVGDLHQISGLFFAHHIDVREARVYTKTDTDIALEIYHVVHQPPYLQDSPPMPLDEGLKKQLVAEIQGLTSGQTTLEEIFTKLRRTDEIREAMSKQWKVYEVEVESGDSHKNYSEIVVTGEERMGFLYFFSGILAKLGLNIEMCKCSGLGGQAVDRFYLKPIEDATAVRQQILAELNDLA